MKKHLYTFLLLLIAFMGKAQIRIDTAAVVAQVNSYPYLFEGKVLDKSFMEDAQTGMIYTSYRVGVSKIFKGNLGCGVTNIVVEGGQGSTHDVEEAHAPVFDPGFMGIFGCMDMPAGLPAIPNPGNQPPLVLRNYETSVIEFHHDPINYIATHYNLSIDSLQLLYSFLQNACGTGPYVSCEKYPGPETWVQQRQILHRSTAVPTVTSINGSTAPEYVTTGGTHDTLKIRGTSFGASRGRIFVPNADDGGASVVQLDSVDIDRWSDTLIVMRFPDILADSATNGGRKTPGSGIFQLITANGDFSLGAGAPAGTINRLKVRYSVMQSFISNTYPKVNHLLMRADAPGWDSVYHFRMNSSITDARMKACIRTAFRRWSCLTGVNFVVDISTTTASPLNVYDTVSTIGTANLQGRTIAVTSSTARTASVTLPYCFWNNNNTLMALPIREIDIRINDSFARGLSGQFFYDTVNYSRTFTRDSIDFYRAILHEIGHALQLGHVNQTDDIMWFEGSVPSLSIPVYRNLHFKQDDKDGGDWIVYRSSTPSGTCIYSGNLFKPMKRLPVTCMPTAAVDATAVNNIRAFEVYPNPASAMLYIKAQSGTTKGRYILSDMAGRTLLSGMLQRDLTAVSLPETLDGLYVLQIISEQGRFNTLVQCGQ